MPANTRPKKFVATTDFSHNCKTFAAGDEVPHGATLRALLAFGDKFVTEDVPARKGTPSTDVGAVDENKEK